MTVGYEGRSMNEFNAAQLLNEAAAHRHEWSPPRVARWRQGLNSSTMKQQIAAGVPTECFGLTSGRAGFKRL
jgi:hypothetical protein